MIAAVRRVLAFEMTIAEWIGTAAMLAIPYLVVGVVWTAFQSDHFESAGGGRIMSILGSILSWPVLVASTVCMT